MPASLKQRILAAALTLLPVCSGVGLAHAGPATEPACGDATADGTLAATDALAVLGAALDLPSPCTPLSCDVIGEADGITASDALAVLRVAVGNAEAGSLVCPTVARVWIEQLLDAIRLDTPRPTVHARNLWHLSIALWDIWVAYDEETPAVPYLSAESPPAPADVAAARIEAMSYAAYRILTHRFDISPGAAESLASFDEMLADLGYDANVTTTDGDTPAALGNRVAAAVIAYGLADGSNEVNDYADDTGYDPINEPLIVEAARAP